MTLCWIQLLVIKTLLLAVSQTVSGTFNLLSSYSFKVKKLRENVRVSCEGISTKKDELVQH